MVGPCGGIRGPWNGRAAGDRGAANSAGEPYSPVHRPAHGRVSRGWTAGGGLLVTPRQGITCPWCGYPVDKPKEQRLCVTCREWCAAVGDTEAAIGYAGREQQTERAERRKQWEARK